VPFGSQGLYCYDMDGAPLWDVDLGDMTKLFGFGEGASPALHGDRLVMIWDHEGGSFIVALDAATGDEMWRQPRDEGSSWNTPLVVDHDGRVQVIVNATNMITSYDILPTSEPGESVVVDANPHRCSTVGVLLHRADVQHADVTQLCERALHGARRCAGLVGELRLVELDTVGEPQLVGDVEERVEDNPVRGRDGFPSGVTLPALGQMKPVANGTVGRDVSRHSGHR